jgi:hypothetical protein
LAFASAFGGSSIPVALVPASAAPTTAPVAAPATAPLKTSPTTFFALLIIPGDERRLPDFFPPLFLLDVEAADFLAGDRFFVDRFFVFFVVTIVLPLT